MDIYKILDQLNEQTKDHTMLYAYAYDPEKKTHSIGFRSANRIDPITDGIVWLIAADAYNTKSKKFIDTIHEFENSNLKDIILHVYAQAIISSNIVTVQLKSKQCVGRGRMPNGTTVVYTKDKD